MTEFITHSNLPLALADTMCKLVKKMRPDSKIAKEIICGRNKATAIVHDLAHFARNDLVERMRNGSFTISKDGSNDEVSKQFPMVVHTINPVTSNINSELLSIPNSATGENIFRLVEGELKSYGVPWSNCIAFGSDNANVMLGHKKGVFAYMKEKQPSLYLSGCSLHLIHIAAKKAADTLPSVDDVLVDIYFYFNKSDKCKSEFKEMQELCDLDQKKMIKHVCTRRLSIGRCVERLLDNWDALKVYFRRQHDLQDSKRQSKTNHKTADKAKGKVPGKKSSGTGSSEVVFKKVYMEPSYAEKKIESILTFVRSPTNRLYVLFLNYTLKGYEEALTSLQAEDPRIHTLRRTLQKHLQNLLIRFVKPSAMVDKPLDQVDYHLRYNLKAHSELVIGEAAKEFTKNKSENHLKDSRISEFYANVVIYFQAACDYMKKKLPLNQPLLQHAEVADVSLKQTAKSSSLLYFLE